MLFTSPVFLLFLAIVVPVFWLLPQRLRAIWLILASYYFYTYSHPEYWWLLFGCTALAYLGGLAMGWWPQRRRQTQALWLSAGAITSLLIYYKYADLFLRTLNTGLKDVHATGRVPLPHPILPVGISFFTFQALSYLFDVYRGRFPVERRFDIFAAYKAFFPQLVAGPIERPGNVIPQLKAGARWDFERAQSGLRLILWGFFKKLLIADRLAPFVHEAYFEPHHKPGLRLLLATYAFAWQILCDFSAYTDIARGSGRLLGIELMENFRAPYFSRSIPEFWSRWHISLSTWFRDYLYIPLGGNRTGWLMCQRNLIIVFLVSGLWHGADWKFAIWGGIHGAIFVLMNVLRRVPWPRVTLGKWALVALDAARVLLTFHLVCFAWIFFRADSLRDAMTIVRALLHGPLRGPAFTSQTDVRSLLIAAAAVCVMEAAHLVRMRTGSATRWLAASPVWVRWFIMRSSPQSFSSRPWGGKASSISNSKSP